MLYVTDIAQEHLFCKTSDKLPTPSPTSCGNSTGVTYIELAYIPRPSHQLSLLSGALGYKVDSYSLSDLPQCVYSQMIAS